MPPPEVTPIRWLLLTTLPVAEAADVRSCVKLYRQRWLIERYHFTLKSGCGIERWQLATAERLQRAFATSCIVAWRLWWADL